MKARNHITRLSSLSPVFLLKNVTLHVWPADAVERGAELRLICVARFVHSGTSLPFLKFSFFKDYNKHNSVHLSQTNTSDQVTHTISRARASHTGTYQCDVTANNQHKESSIKSIVVKGTEILSLGLTNVYTVIRNVSLIIDYSCFSYLICIFIM